MSTRPSFQTFLYILALSLALIVRLFNLGAAPLNDTEASWALSALQITRPEMASTSLVLGPQPAYTFLTSLTFLLTGGNNFSARLWPALIGALLVLVPLLFRRELGRLAAVLLAFGLALDPGLVAASRQAGGPVIALTFTLLATGLWRTRQPVLAGLCAGLALCGGPAVIPGILGLALTWALTRYIKPNFPLETGELPPLDQHQATANLRPAAIAAIITILLVSTQLFRHPQGLSAWAATLTTYLDGWRLLVAAPGDSSAALTAAIPAMRLVTALLFYQPFAVILGLFSVTLWLIYAIQGSYRGPNPPILPGALALFSLVMVLVYPARQVSDLVWPLVSLWALAACELSQQFSPAWNDEPSSGSRALWVSLIQASLILILGALFWVTMISTAGVNAILDTKLPWELIRLGVLVVVVALLALTTILVAMGWTWRTSRDGLLWGMLAIFGIYTTSALWGATQLRPNMPEELWGVPPATVQADLFLDTLHNLSRWKTGYLTDIEVLSAVDAPSLRWVLRDFPNARFGVDPSLPFSQETDQPGGRNVSTPAAIVITRQEQSNPTLADSYRGQDFVWWSRPGWSGALPPDFVNWLAFRQAPRQDEQIILWARADIFPGGSEDLSGSTTTTPLEPQDAP